MLKVIIKVCQMRRYLDCLKIKTELGKHLVEDIERLLTRLTTKTHVLDAVEPKPELSLLVGKFDPQQPFKCFHRRPTLGVLLWENDQPGKYFVSKKLDYLKTLDMDGIIQEIDAKAETGRLW